MTSKAYPPTWASDAALRAAASRWQRRGLLTAAQQAAIDAAYPTPYYRPNHWVRVLLFGATLLGASTGFGFLASLTGFHLNPLAYGVLALLGAVAALEWLIKSARHYRSGVDNALLYCALGA